MRDPKAIFLSASKNESKGNTYLNLSFAAQDVYGRPEIKGYNGTVVNQMEFDKVKNLSFGDLIDLVYSENKYGRIMVDMVVSVPQDDTLKKK